MSKIVAMWPPQAGERELVERHLPGLVGWAVDGESPKDADGLLMFWPKRELAAAGLTWSDVAGAKWAKIATAGVNHIGWHDGPRIPIMSTPGATGSFIAEYVLGCILAWSRGLFDHTARIRKGDFQQGAPARGLAELRVGLVGYGGIGQATAKLLSSLGCTVAAVSRSGQADEGALQWVETLQAMQHLPELFATCDVVVLCVPLTTQTEGLVGIDLLSGMAGRQALLVNVSRGNVVLEDELFAWLDSSHTKHWAALDVWWQYPGPGGLPFSHDFHKLPNVIMTPHNSPNVTGFRQAMIARACEDVKAILAGGTLTHVEDPATYQTRAEGDAR